MAPNYKPRRIGRKYVMNALKDYIENYYRTLKKNRRKIDNED